MQGPHLQLFMLLPLYIFLFLFNFCLLCPQSNYTKRLRFCHQSNRSHSYQLYFVREYGCLYNNTQLLASITSFLYMTLIRTHHVHQNHCLNPVPTVTANNKNHCSHLFDVQAQVARNG